MLQAKIELQPKMKEPPSPRSPAGVISRISRLPRRGINRFHSSDESETTPDDNNISSPRSPRQHKGVERLTSAPASATGNDDLPSTPVKR